MEQAFGGVTGHTFDLMALDSNAVICRDGVQLPHFSPTLSPRSQGVNLFCQDLGEMDNMSNPYVFPPFALLGPVLSSSIVLEFLSLWLFQYISRVHFGGRS